MLLCETNVLVVLVGFKMVAGINMTLIISSLLTCRADVSKQDHYGVCAYIFMN